jgi:hypothetical protein
MWNTNGNCKKIVELEYYNYKIILLPSLASLVSCKCNSELASLL